MAVDQTKVVDVVSRDKNGEIVLSISDHLNWEDTVQHLSTLQEKINTYIAFVDGGEIYSKFPEAKGQRIVIEILFHYAPSPEGSSFIARVKPMIEAMGFEFRSRLFAASPYHM